MGRFFALALLVGLGLSASGCGNGESSPKVKGPVPVVTLPFEATALAADPEDARLRIESAIGAHGGELLVKARTLVRTVKGEIQTPTQPVEFTGEVQLQLPAQARIHFELGSDKVKLPVILILNKDRGWRSGNGAVKDMSSSEMNDLREELYVNWLATLAPILNDKLDVASLPEIKVNNEPALGVKVASKGRPDVKLYFDKGTSLLVKAEHPGKEADVDVFKEYFFSDFKLFQGVKLPTKWLILANGKRVAEWTVTGLKLPEKIEESVFGKP